MDYKKNPQWITYPDLQSVEGKAVLVGGGSTAMGRATMMLLASRGARVMLFGRHRRELDEALHEAHSINGEVYSVVADEADPGDVERIFDAVDEQLGEIDVLVNIASVTAGSMLEGSPADWRYVLHSNVLGHMHCCRLAVERMSRQSKGHIFNIGSLSADSTSPGEDIFMATKSAIRGFSESLRSRIDVEGIKVTLIEPGPIDVSLHTNAIPEHPEHPGIAEESQILLKPEDVAECIYYCLIQPPRCDVVDVKIRPHLEPKSARG